MSRKIRIEFEEVAGYPQIGTTRLWVDGREVVDDFEKARFLHGLKL